MVVALNNTLYGAQAFTVAGCGVNYPPHWAIIDVAVLALTTTATRLYFIPYYFPDIVAYSGIRTRNTGSGDSGDTFRMGVYQMNQTTKLPGALVQDCGQVTLTGAAADRTLAQSFTPAYIGWHYIAFHANQAADMARIVANLQVSAVGYMPGRLTMFGTVNVLAGANGGDPVTALFVDTAYGALAPTAVTPTGCLVAAPIIAPYRT